MDFEDQIDEDLLLAIELSETLKSPTKQDDISKKTDEDFQYALKLSQQLNGPNLVSAEKEDTIPSKFTQEIDDRDYLLAVQLAEDSYGTKRKNINESSSSIKKFRKEEHDNNEFSSDVTDNDFLLAVQLAERSSETSDQDHALALNLDQQSSSVGATFHSEIDHDFLLALQLAEQDSDLEEIDLTKEEQPKKKYSTQVKKGNSTKSEDDKYSDQTLSVVDPSWETIDPNPNIYSLFMAFNKRFFWGRLDMVEVKWSPRMTLCAGVCSYRSRAGHCIVSLSKPLLSYRPRKDLVQTLLHEMIHAYLFVTKNNRDRDGHGEEFHKHMYRINRESGSKITVYHDFHDEVKMYKTHWWKCDGPCQHQRPFFGLVKRSMNRAPGPNDTWWAHHLATCGGKYHKIREPEGYGKKDSKKKNDVPATKTDKIPSIAGFFNRPTTSNTSSSTSNKNLKTSSWTTGSSTKKPVSSSGGPMQASSSSSSSSSLLTKIPVTDSLSTSKSSSTAGNMSSARNTGTAGASSSLVKPRSALFNSLNSPLPTAKPSPKPMQSHSTNAKKSTNSTFGNNKIFTLSDLAKNMNQRSPTKSPTKSPKKWTRLPGQQNIFHFLHK